MLFQFRLPFGHAALPQALGIGVGDQSPVFERIAYLAARATHAPMALVTLVTEGGQWNVGRYGVDDPGLPLSSSICQRLLPAQTLSTVADVAVDPRMASLQLIAALKGVRFYAGQPVIFRGQSVGMVCVLDERPRTLHHDDEMVLVDLAALAGDWLERLECQAVGEAERQRAADFARLAGDGFWELDAQGRCTWASDNFAALAGGDPSGLPQWTVPAAGGATPTLLREHFERGQDLPGLVVVPPSGAVPLQLKAVVLRDEQGTLLGYRGFVRPVAPAFPTAESARPDQVEH